MYFCLLLMIGNISQMTEFPFLVSKLRLGVTKDYLSNLIQIGFALHCVFHDTTAGRANENIVSRSKNFCHNTDLTAKLSLVTSRN